jgi:spore coat polysaccharide biosynthesis protein SpsF (cytidylyltransferase family)
MMRVGAVVQARMGSSRLPGKVLADLAGRPAIEWLIERLDHATKLDAVVVATSTDRSDDAIETWCAANGVACHRGPLDDVASRMLAAARAHRLDAFVRVNADSPLLDQRLVDEAVELYRSSDVDLVTNVRPRAYPPGQSVEVVRTDALERAFAGDVDAGEREHVTGPLYGDGFTRLRLEPASPRTDPPMTLDTRDDHDRLGAILQSMERPHWDYRWDEIT